MTVWTPESKPSTTWTKEDRSAIKDRWYEYVVDEDGNYITDENGNRILAERSPKE